MPKSFTHKKRHTAEGGPGPGRPRRAHSEPPPWTACREDRAKLVERLWLRSYVEVIADEAAEVSGLSDLMHDVIQARQSTYHAQHRGGAAAREQQDERIGSAVASLAAQVQRLGNQNKIPLLVAARSISWLLTMARTKQWGEVARSAASADYYTATRRSSSCTA